MKLVVTAGLLRSAFLALGKLAAQRSLMPVLQMVRFDGARLTATDLDLEISVPFAAIEAEGRACIAASSLRRLLANMAATDELTITTDDKGARLKTATGIYRLPVLPATDFPELAIEGEEWTALAGDGAKLKQALKAVHSVASTEELCYYLNGVCLRGSEAAATDGHRMAVADSGVAAVRGMILPNGMVAALLRLPVPEKLWFSAKRPLFRAECAGGIVLTGRLIDGTYLDYRRLIPKETATEFSFSPAAALAAARRLSVVGDGKGGMNLIGGNGALYLVVPNGYDGETGIERLDAAGVPNGFICSINIRYFTDLMRACRGCESVTLRTIDPHAPFLVDCGDGVTRVQMPIRTHSAPALEVVADALGERVAA